ncbi:MAG TPA: Crp/Fnr family transcriptional regulator [Patescibacteria group bacterium]|nr:Crp/Fnr family transcriptional regulator [Patescibacteria group bacterium]
MLTDDSQRSALVNLFHQGTRLVYEKGEFVIRPGGPPQGVFYILSGLVKAYDITKYGEENLLIIRKPGETIGMTWSITGQDRHIIYATLAPTELLQITREQFTTFLKANPAAALPLVDMLVDMYRLHSERILSLEYRTVRERLVSFLLSMTRRFGKESSEGMVLEVPLRHQDIASSISATRESVGRELAAFERQGLVSNSQLTITIKDLPRLRKILE